MICRVRLLTSAALLAAVLASLPACNNAKDKSVASSSSKAVQDTAYTGSAKPEDVAAIQQRLTGFGSAAQANIEGGRLTQIIVQDGASLTEDDVKLLGRLTDLTKLQIFNCRSINDDMVKHLLALKELESLALVNTVINDASVKAIISSFPKLTDLDLSSNTNLTAEALKLICEKKDLQRLTLIQTGFNDITTRRLSNLQELRTLDLRGNMQAGDMTLESVSKLPKLTLFKHRSTAVTDYGMEYLSKNTALENLLIQDFAISSQSGEHLAKLQKLKQLEIFRCPGFGSDGVLALKELKQLDRLTLRDLPSVDDQALEVFAELPKLRRLYLHELGSISDSGLANLAALKSLEQLDIWNVPQLTDASLDALAGLPNLKDLSLRSTDITDAAIEKILKLPALQSLTLKDNSNLTAGGLKQLSSRKWAKLDIGS